MRGFAIPVSHLAIVERSTPIAAATDSWEYPRFFLIFAKEFT